MAQFICIQRQFRQMRFIIFTRHFRCYSLQPVQRPPIGDVHRKGRCVKQVYRLHPSRHPAVVKHHPTGKTANQTGRNVIGNPTILANNISRNFTQAVEPTPISGHFIKLTRGHNPLRVVINHRPGIISGRNGHNISVFHTLLQFLNPLIR